MHQLILYFFVQILFVPYICFVVFEISVKNYFWDWPWLFLLFRLGLFSLSWQKENGHPFTSFYSRIRSLQGSFSEQLPVDFSYLDLILLRTVMSLAQRSQHNWVLSILIFPFTLQNIYFTPFFQGQCQYFPGDPSFLLAFQLNQDLYMLMPNFKLRGQSLG